MKKRFFHILVESEAEAKVKIKVPLVLIKAGLKLVHLIPVQGRDALQKALQKKGVPFDWNEMCALNAEELLEALEALEIAIDDSEGETIRIFSD